MKGFLFRLVRRLFGAEIDSVVNLSKIEAAIVYLKVLKGTRRLAILLCLLVFFIVALACGMLLIPIALLLFMPWSPEVKTIVAASFGAAYVIVPLIVVMSLFSQRRWMRMSGVGKLVNEALTQESETPPNAGAGTREGSDT
jgi:hypothetical protein